MKLFKRGIIIHIVLQKKEVSFRMNSHTIYLFKKGKHVTQAELAYAIEKNTLDKLVPHKGLLLFGYHYEGNDHHALYKTGVYK
jgi:hypothetical protein